MGAPAGALLKAVLRGHIGTVQTWSIGLWLDTVAGGGGVDPDAAAALLLPDAHTMANSLKGYWSTDTTFEGIDTAFYPGGTTVASRTGHAVDSSPVAGVSSTNLLPTFCAVCCTLKTSHSGRSYRGRVYWPITAAGLSTDGQIDNSVCSAFANALKTMLQAWHALDMSSAGLAGSGGNQPTVVSFTRALSTFITAIQVDSKLDVQHRREDKIGAAHTALVTV